MSPSPSARASSSVSCRRVEIEMVLARPLSRAARAMDDPIRPIPISAIFSNITLVLCPRRAERLQDLDQPPHGGFRPDLNPEAVLDPIDADLAHDQPLVEQRLECRAAGLGVLEQGQDEICLARHYPDGIAVERPAQPAAPFGVVL